MATLLLASCATTPSEPRVDNLPMYGQPTIPRPEALKKGDEEFIKQAAVSLGSREAASKAWNTQAEEFMSKGDLDYAMRRYNQSWLLNPDNYQPYWGFGRVLLERDKLDESILYFEKAKQLINDPYQKVALLSDAGIAYSFKANSFSADRADERARYFKLANQHFMESTRLDSKYTNAWERWANSLYREGKYAESWEKVKKARSLGAKVSSSFIKNLENKMSEPK
jgi:Tfp pilus assembly protein PilF